MDLESTVSVAKPGVRSVRATVPEGIVAFLDLKVGDKLVWKMEVVNNAERVALVAKKATVERKSAHVDLDYQRPARVKRTS